MYPTSIISQPQCLVCECSYHLTMIGKPEIDPAYKAHKRGVVSEEPVFTVWLHSCSNTYCKWHKKLRKVVFDSVPVIEVKDVPPPTDS